MLDTPLTTRLNALLATLELAAATGLLSGDHALGHRVARTDGDIALARLRKDSAEAAAKAAEDARLRLVTEIQRNNRLAQELADEKSAHAREKQALIRRIADVTNVPAPGLAPEHRAVFTAGFMREYNAAVGLPATGGGAAAAGTGTAAETAPTLETRLRDSGLGQADLLAHIADYGERCRNLESQVNRLLDRNKEAADGHR